MTWGIAFACVALAAGCSSSKPRAAPSTTTIAASPPSSTTTTIASQPCTPGEGYEPGTSPHSITVNSAPREMLVHLPPKPRTRMPLVVDFHGAGSNMTEQDIYSGFDPVADKQGFVVASPNGADQAVRQWRFLGPDDLAFARSLVDELVKHSCVDRDRVYATGISSGAAMSTSLACRASDVFHAFGLVAAEFYSPPLCGKAKVRPIVLFHGNADPIVPYRGGAINAPGAGSGFAAPGAESAIAGWAKHNGCTGSPIETHTSAHVIKHSWNGCTQPVVLYEIVGGGHTWPGAAIDVTRLGNTTHEISATNTMLEVFQAAP